MANFNYTAGVKFQPFSFEEMLRPLAMYTQEYNALEQAYGDLNTKANEIAALANETDDPITYQRYKNFENAVRDKANIMAKQGLDTTSRRQLLDMRSRFATDIIPIQNAIQRRNMLAEEQRKALLQNPTLMFQRDFNTRSYDTSLDRFLENANYDYGDQYSGALLTQEVSRMAANLARELRGTSKGKLDDYTNTFLKKYGLSSGEVLYAIQNPNDPRGSRALRAIYDAAVEKVPESLRNLYGRDIERYASQGFWSAIGKDELGTYENYENKLRDKNKPPQDSNIPYSIRNIPVGKGTMITTPTLDKLNNLINIGKDGNSIKKITIKGNNKTLRSKFSDFEEPTFEYTSNVKNFDLFDKNNKLMTKEQFLEQARYDKEYLKEMKNFYETNVEPLLKQAGETNANNVSFDDLNVLQQVEDYNVKRYGTSTFMKVIDFPIGSTKKDIEEGLGNLKNQEIWELGMNKEGVLDRVKSKQTLGKLLSSVEDDASFNTYISEQEGQESIVVQIDDKLYQIPINREISSGEDVLTSINKHKQSVLNKNEDAAKQNIQEIISRTGFYSGYTYKPTQSKVIESTGIK